MSGLGGHRLDESETARLVRAFDWGATPLGPMDEWPAELRIAVDMALASPIAMAITWGADFRMVYNQAYAQIAGPRHPAAMGKPAREVWPEVWEEWNRPVLARVRAGESIAARDQRMLLGKDPATEERWFDAFYSPLRGPDGGEGGTLCIAIECTGRKRAEGALKASEHQLRTVAAAVPHQIWVTDADGHFRWFNTRVYDFVGEEPDVELNDQWMDFVHPDDIGDLTAAWQKSLTTETRFEHSYRLRSPNSDYRWHLARAVPTREADGEVRWIGTNTDIHDQRGEADALLARNAALEHRVALRTQERDRIWNVSRDLLLVADQDGLWLAINPAWTATLGWDEAQLLGREAIDLVHPDDRPATRDELKRLARGEATGRFENRLRARDGSYRVISWTAAAVDDLLYCVARDITAEREAAQALAEAEAALRQAQKMEMIGQLTGGIAHDFNNLIQGISGSLDIVRRRLAEGRLDDIERFLVGAVESAERAGALTHRLLAFARRQPLDPRPTRANGLIESMRDLLGRTLGERISLEYDLAPGLWRVRCDPNQLEGALLNLAINGRDAMPDGGTLTIATANLAAGTAAQSLPPDLAPGDYVRIAVSDTGTGMAPDVIARAFEPFFTTKPIGQGTGLGLASIYGFARQSKGEVAIESELGRGTTVALYLPRHMGADDAASDTASGDMAITGRGETILVIEDEPVVRALIVELLDDLGYCTLAADDAEPGLELLRSGAPIDLMITDIGLPGMDGRDLGRIAREMRPGLPILYMTGYADTATDADDIAEEGTALITKPFGGPLLADRVAAMLRRA